MELLFANTVAIFYMDMWVYRKRGLEVQLTDRYGYSSDLINWADMIITVGGDGTFLMAASKVTSQSKPVIGINADPKR